MKSLTRQSDEREDSQIDWLISLLTLAAWVVILILAGAGIL